MIKILFVCLGNICRSPMAEFIMKDLVKRQGLDKGFLIESRATSAEEQGCSMHYEAVSKLHKEKVALGQHFAKQLEPEDYNNYDYIIGMDKRNYKNILRIVGEDSEQKVSLLLDYTKHPGDIADPWYSGDFDKAYDDILEGCKALLKELEPEVFKK